MKTFFTGIFAGLVFIGIAGTMFAMCLWAINTQEVGECRTWTANAKVLNNYYFTQWQADQCAAHGITVNAPIK